LALCKGAPPVCQGCKSPSQVIACVAYDKKIYAGYNLSEVPALSIAILDDVHDEAKCLALSEDELTSKPKDQQFNGVTFKTVIQEEGAMSHAYRTYFYRTFHSGRCYDLELHIATVNIGVLDPAEHAKEFTDADERKVVGNFTRMLNTLRL